MNNDSFNEESTNENDSQKDDSLEVSNDEFEQAHLEDEADKEASAQVKKDAKEVDSSESQDLNTLNTVKRPWQGTFLGVLNIIGVILMVIFLIFALLVVGVGFFAVSKFGTSALGFSAVAGIALIIPFIIMLIINIFVIRATFKGGRWAIILMMVVTFFSMLSTLLSLFSLFTMDEQFVVKIITTIISLVFGFVINGFFFWLEWSCYKHPFYNRNK